MGAGVDVTFDCAGFNKTITTALNATQPGGKVCLVGMGHSEMTVPLTAAAASKQFKFLLDYLYYFKTMRCADFIVKEPMVIGHECARIIEEVGSQIQTLVPSDRVAVEPGISCWPCDHCKLGRYNLCPEMNFFATPPVHGSLANQIVHPADLCFKLPDNVSLEEGAMCEPLSVGFHACRRANIGPETNVLIMGAGPIGLVTMLSARAFVAPRIVVVDVDDHRLSVAKSLGADDIVKVSTNIQVFSIRRFLISSIFSPLT
ncbi:unnamed protein product [Trifolium pratense]|uniref:Uncharacterized protein n=1 Tax=Trifolium pratense TaxID=57577 RepID=A0ACB0KMR6_TRIPR|nr:unnamed protein product [Trifolium pratense]